MSDETWVVTLPKLGETVTEGVIGSLFKHVGDEVEFDDPLFEVSTDKVDTEVPSSYDGVVLEVLAQEGDTVSVGAAIMRIGGKGAHGGRTDSRRPHTGWRRPAAGRSTMPSAPSVGGSEGPTTEERRLLAVRARARFSRSRCRSWASRSPRARSARWFKAVGDDVEFDDPLFDVSTDKVDSEIPSPYDGKMLDILVSAGETVPVGTVLARIGAAGLAGGAATARPATAAGRPAVGSPRAVSARPRAAPVGPRCRRRRTAVVAIGAQARRRERHRRRRRLPGRASVVGSGARTSMNAIAAGPDRDRRPGSGRLQRAAGCAPGVRRPAPTAGTKWCRSAGCG